MLFVGIRGEPDRARTEEVSSLWAQSLQNGHIQVNYYTNTYIHAFSRSLIDLSDGLFRSHKTEISPS